MPHSSRIKKWAWRSLLVALVLAVASLLWADYQLNRFAGAYTEVVDPARFKLSTTGLTAITDVHVLSPDGSAMVGGQTVLFDQNGIISVNADARLPEAVVTIDGNGQYLIPGLIDSHVHLRQSPNDLLLYVANGVTQIREMSGNAAHLAWRDEIQKGRVGPRIFVASKKLVTWGWLKGHWVSWTRQNRINITSPENVEATIQSLADAGYDAVKLGSHIHSKDMYRQINLAADEAGLPVIGHLPIAVGLPDLWRSGQSELSHIEEIVKALNAEFGYFDSQDADRFLDFVARRSDEVASRLADNGIAVTSTLSHIDRIPRQKLDLVDLLHETRLGYANPGQVEGTPLSRGWLPGDNSYQVGPGVDASELAAIRIYWTTWSEAQRIVLAALQDEGVQLMAGTDAGNAVTVPGFSLHDELKALTEAGMRPSQSLRSATAVPADWMQIRAGRILPGYRADMVLLRKNPLQDIENTSTIEAVVLDGHLIDRGQLDAMLDAVKGANDRSRSMDIGRFQRE